MKPLKLRRIADRQHGLFTLADASNAAVSRAAVRHMAARGTIRRVARGVYAFSGPSSFEQAALAACLAADGIACRWTAARLYGLASAAASPLHVLVAPAAKRRSRDGIVVHHGGQSVRRVLIDRVPMTSPARTLADLAAGGASRSELADLVALFISRQTTSIPRLSAALERECAAVPGVVEARHVLRELGGPIESVLEARFLRLVAAWDLPEPVIQHEVRIEGRRYRADVAWPEFALVVEIDGFAHHSSHEAFERDRARGNDLASAGLTVLRVTAAQIDDGAPALRRHIESAMHRRPAPGADRSNTVAYLRTSRLSCHPNRPCQTSNGRDGGGEPATRLHRLRSA